MLNPYASPFSVQSGVINESECTQKRDSFFSASAWSVNVFNYFEAGFYVFVLQLKLQQEKPSINVFSLLMTMAPIYLIGTIEWEKVPPPWMLTGVQEKVNNVLLLPPLQSVVTPAAHAHEENLVLETCHWLDSFPWGWNHDDNMDVLARPVCGTSSIAAFSVVCSVGVDWHLETFMNYHQFQSSSFVRPCFHENIDTVSFFSQRYSNHCVLLFTTHAGVGPHHCPDPSASKRHSRKSSNLIELAQLSCHTATVCSVCVLAPCLTWLSKWWAKPRNTWTLRVWCYLLHL